MAEIEDREQFALLLSQGISALREHPEFKTRRKKREALPSGRTFSESYIDRISVPLGISPNTIKSWMGQMGNRYIPSRIEDGKLFGLLWMIMEKGVMDARWFNDLLHATSIPVIEPPVPAWFASCFKKAKILREDGTYGPPSEESIPSVAESAFDGLSRQGADTTEKLAEDNRHNLPRRWLEIFVGREQDLQAINQWLWSSSSVCLITGWGGMGKSTLALETAYACISDSHGVARKFKWPVFSYVIWISAEPKQLTFSDFLDTIAYQLGRVELLEKSLIEKRLVVRNALAAAAIQLPVFLIIDSLDTAEAEIYEFVANMPQGIKVLMTARENPSTVHALSIRDMDIITLVGLKDAEALEYLHKEVTHHWNLSNLPVKKQRLKDLLEEKTEVLLQLIAATAGNPKAISLSVAYMIDDDLSPKQLVGEIEKASYSLSTLFNYLFGRSWERCSEDAKRLWQTLGFFDKSPVEESWSKIAGLDARRFHAALEQLKSFALVETERSRDTIQYRAHQTVLSYGEKRLTLISEWRM
ncbi:NB-ARC domain-containing protein [Cohnella caldifontis]|uniref:NB-ARC domain-containing protein n=1 Tax=Cohnella caldifontis TaxID=3027471 RepID=UPI0023EAB85D|nr:ATP-binding protein [Cohnella sp. YIM B05605]